MDRGLLEGAGQVSENSAAIEYAEKCIEIYEETIRAMGLPGIETRREFIENSQLVYAHSSLTGEEYAHLPEDH